MKLTKTQEGILNAEEVVGGAISNICGATFFTQRYSVEKLNTAVNTVVRINDAFRLHFDKKTKTQWVEEYRWQDYETVCFDSQADFELYARKFAAAPMDFAVSLFDLKIVEVNGKRGLLYVLHHVICDAWSLSLLRWQLHQILEEEIIPHSFSFMDYCRGLSSYYNSRRFGADRSYFLSQFRGHKEDLPAIDPPARSFQSSSLTFEIPSDLSDKIKNYLEKDGVSQFVLLLAAFGICYSKRHNDAGCFYVGTTILNRTTEKDLRTIGPYIDDVPLLFDLQGGLNAREVLRNTEEMVFNAFRHHRFNYPMLQEEIRGETSDPRLYDVIFNYQAEYEILGDYPAQWFQTGRQYEPLQIHIDHRNDSNKLMVTYNYLLEKYSDRDVERLHRHYMNVLGSVTGNDEQPVRGISLMDREERTAVEKLSRGRIRQLPEKSLYHLIEEQESGSVVDGATGSEYSLSALKRDAEKIDATVRAVRETKRVIAVICERSYAELAAIYGVIRGGNAYLPISPEFPPERIASILGISSCDTVLTQRKYRHLAPGAMVIEDILSGQGSGGQDSGGQDSGRQGSSGQGSDGQGPGGQESGGQGAGGQDPSPALPIAALPEDLLYVIFTSGSTGQPKGAMISNRSAVNRILWMADRYFSPETTVMLKTPFTFDVSVWEIFGFAVAGFRLYILPPLDHYRQDRVIDHIYRGKVTDIHFVPSVFSSFLDALDDQGAQDAQGSQGSPDVQGVQDVQDALDAQGSPDVQGILEEGGSKTDSLKNIFLSGEALPASLVRRAPALVHNLYGPTECAVDVTYYDCTGTETDPVPIGYPVDNCRMYILNRNLQPVPVGVKGQICIAGVPVGIGYIRDPARTAERFVPDPYGAGQMYLTGDIGYWNDDGAIVYVGRNDRQVKINGQRIEPEEIETALMQLVPEAAVIVEEGRLIAFYTGKESASLRKELGGILPGYMIPHSFTHVKEMPRMASGKIDRSALRQIPREERKYEPPVNETERKLCALFSEVLKKESVGRSDSFFDLGGTSLDMLSLLCRPPLDQLSPPDFMTHSSPAELAALLGSTEAAASLVPLYLPDQPFHSGIILFPYAGGDAAAYTALVAEFKKRKAPAALYFLSWGENLDGARTRILELAGEMEIRFYSHCAGSAIAMKLLEQLNGPQMTVGRYFAGADIPPARAENIWKTISDRELMKILSRAGLPQLPQDRMEDLIIRFRSNTEEYFEFLGSRREKIPCRVTLILSRKDLFTQDYQNAVDRWSQYVVAVGDVHYIDSPTHYFQSTEAAALADILLSED
ncbi:MAG: AMP-binding protein [Lachnospiraceae bacterium]|nr:AMP-binding protein [Lachnospiraceae bacterium]